MRVPTRSGFCVTGFQIATFDTSIGMSFATMPPGWFFIGLGRVCRLTWLMPLTTTCVASTTRATSPRLPLSRPAMTTTLSPFLILPMSVLSLQHFGRERHDLHEPLVAQLARHGSEDARADRLELGVEQHRRVGVEADARAVAAAHAMARAHDHGAVDLALLHAAARRCFLDADLDHVADMRIAALGTAEHLDAHHRTRARIVGDVHHRLHLDHVSTLSNLAGPAKRALCCQCALRMARASFGPRPGKRPPVCPAFDCWLGLCGRRGNRKYGRKPEAWQPRKGRAGRYSAALYRLFRPPRPFR